MINATDVVGALHQDRHSGIEGVLGAESHMVPVSMKVRSVNDKNAVVREKDFHMSVFVQQKWTPYLMMLSLYNSLSQFERIRRRRHLPAQRRCGNEREAADFLIQHADLG